VNVNINVNLNVSVNVSVNVNVNVKYVYNTNIKGETSREGNTSLQPWDSFQLCLELSA
jgi:hypothetical protein